MNYSTTNKKYNLYMIGILGGMGTQAGLDFCNKLAILYRGKFDQDYPLFILYNKSNIPGRPESIGVQTGNLSNKKNNKKSQKKYLLVLKSLIKGCQVLKKSKCKFIVIPCNTAHYWYEDLQKSSVNKSIKFVKMGKIREAEKAIRPAVNYLIKIKCKKIILGCTELPIAIFAYKSFKKIKESKIFVDPNLLIANVSMKKYKKLKKQ